MRLPAIFHRRPKLARGLLVLAVLLVGVRIALPYVLEEVIDDRLQALDGYTGDVDDVDLALWRMAYRIEGIQIDRTEGGANERFFEAGALSFSLDWGAILDGEIVAEADLWSPRLRFVLAPNEEESQTGEGADWQDALTDFAPVDINRFTIHDGETVLIDRTREPHYTLAVSSLETSLHDIQNTQESSDELPSSIELRATVQHSGRLQLDARFDLLRDTPAFDGDASLRGLPLPEVNPFLAAFGGVDAEDGSVAVYAEARSSDGRVHGYVKPILEGVDLHDFGESGDFLDRFGDFFANLGAELLENQPNDRIATRVELQGDLESPEADGWAVVGGILRNAFLEAFRHGLDHSV